jgi:hypothetical protein
MQRKAVVCSLKVLGSLIRGSYKDQTNFSVLDMENYETESISDVTGAQGHMQSMSRLRKLLHVKCCLQIFRNSEAYLLIQHNTRFLIMK